MTDRFDAAIARLLTCVTGTPGQLSSDARRALQERARRVALREPLNPSPQPAADVPPGLVAYADTVTRHAYKVTDEDVERLKREGMSEDAIFEATALAAVGAGLARLDRAMALLKGAR